MRRLFAVLLLVVLLVSAVPAAAKGPVNGVDGTKNYIVRMSDEPVVAYKGGIKGLKATAPKQGQKVDPLSADVVTYVSYLTGKHNGALDKVGGAKKLYDYYYSFNGFAAALTAEQAAKLATVEGVISVSEDMLNQLDTSSTPTFLGLKAEKVGLWSMGATGEDVIIGIVDGGIWPESLSFSDRTGENGNATKDGKLDYQQIPGWHGKCVPGEEFAASDCNQKLIGAQYFNAGWGGNDGIDAQLPWEFNSPRDFGGHGTHTSSTAGGNANVAVTGAASVFGSISGIAPRARIATYKVCWQTPTAGSCYSSDSVAAIDQAVADGVDVINFSISGSQTNFRDPVEISFMYAAAAGVFVAASAGNSGATSTVAHPGPWLTTVAAGTHDRNYDAVVTLGNGVSYTGASVNQTGVGPAPLIDSMAAGLPDANPTNLALCTGKVDAGTTGLPADADVVVLDPAKVAGKIVVCDRGVTARVNKSLAAFEAGAVGVILVNTSTSSLNGDFHIIPTVHLAHTDRAAVKTYAATDGATAQIFPAYFKAANAPFTASFSSRGPLRASGDLLKPDLMAPGQDILAAVAPPGNGGVDFALYSGTSMSSPHVAGLAALLKDLHPDWSPMVVKSALMTTAYDVLDGPGYHPTVAFRQGAGHVDPNKAVDPGLVFDSNFIDWLGFLCGTQLPVSFCTDAGVPVIAPYNFNSPSIAISALPGSKTVTREVTNVGGKKSTYTFSFKSFNNALSADVLPATFTLNPGQSQDLQITIKNVTGALNAYAGGQLTFTDGTHTVRIPVVAQPVALGAPAQVSGSYDVTFGYAGPFTATARGLVPAVTFENTIATGEQQTYEVVVPAGATYARFSLFDANVTPASDLDLVVYGPTGALVGSSGGGTSAEEVNLLNPGAGTYTVLVDGYATGGPTADYTLFTWVLGTADAGNMTVTAPPSATLYATGTINLAFSGLTPGTKYLGSVAYGGAAGMPNPTIVRVDP